MTIEQALMTYLLAQTGITTLVGQRIYFVRAPQETETPYIAISKIDAPREHSHDGSSQLAHPRFQFSIFADTYGEIKPIAAALQTALQGYTGTMGGAGGVFVGNCLYDNETDLDPGEQGLFGVACDYIIWHTDS